MNRKDSIQNYIDSFRNNSKYWIANMYSKPSILLRIQYTHHKIKAWSRTPKRVKTLRKIMWHSFIRRDYTTAHMMLNVLSNTPILRKKDSKRFHIIQQHFQDTNHDVYVLNHRNENTIPSVYIMLKAESENRALYVISKALCIWFHTFKNQHNHLMAFQISQLEYTLPQSIVNPLIYNNYNIQLSDMSISKPEERSKPIETFPKIENLM